MIDRRNMIALGLTVASTAAAFPALSRTPPLDPSASAALDAMVAQSSTVGGGLVAVRGGQVVGQYYWGKASLDFDIPVTERTLFHLGSNGKVVTAIAVLQLLRAANLTVDQAIGDILPDLPPLIGKMSLRQLMNHTSGLADYSDVLEDWDREQPRTAIEAAVVGAPVLFQPGASWQYSNTNYVVLGWLIEHLSGQTYADYIRTRIFEPAGLPTARADANEHIIPHRAAPFLISAKGEVTHAVRMADGVSRAADGGVLMSALDAAPWRVALDGNRLVPAEDMALILKPAVLNSGRLAPYGFGVFLEQFGGKPFLQHGGGVPGFISRWVTWPQSGLSILAMTNAMAAGDMRVDLSRMINVLAESIQPGIAAMDGGSEGDGRDARSLALKGLLTRLPDAPVPIGLLAPEVGEVSSAIPPPVKNLIDLVPVESWQAGQRPEQGEMVRYRLERQNRSSEFVVGWTPNNQIYWI